MDDHIKEPISHACMHACIPTSHHHHKMVLWEILDHIVCTFVPRSLSLSFASLRFFWVSLSLSIFTVQLPFDLVTILYFKIRVFELSSISVCSTLVLLLLLQISSSPPSLTTEKREPPRFTAPSRVCRSNQPSSADLFSLLFSFLRHVLEAYFSLCLLACESCFHLRKPNLKLLFFWVFTGSEGYAFVL